MRLDGSLIPSQFTDTDVDGVYRLDRMPGGNYTITVEKPGFIGRSMPVVLKDGMALRADLVVWRAAAIEGRLLTDDGEPAQNVTVSAVRFVSSPQGRRAAAIRQTRTDDLGRFRVYSLPPGEYYIDASPNPQDAMSVAWVPGEPRLGLARTYYPGTPRVNDAQKIRLSVAQEAGGLDFTMTRVPLARVSGLATDSTGMRTGAFAFRLQPVGDANPVPGLDDRRGAVFEFSTVPPGEYWLTGTATPRNGDPEFMAVRINAAGRDISDVVIRTSPGARLDGLLFADANATAPLPHGLHVIAHQTEFQLPTPRGSALSDSVAVGVDGRFAFRSVFGPRLFRLDRVPPGLALVRVMLDDLDITDVPVDFRASTIPRLLRLFITDRTATVMGTVTDLARAGVEDARIVVFAEDERRWTPPSRFVKTARPVDGRFVIDGLLPGAYLVCAVQGDDDESAVEIETLRRLKPASAKLALAQGDRQTVALTVRNSP